MTINDPWLTLPHPHMLERAFVLVPLSEIRPDLVVGRVRIADALARLDTARIERLPPTP
jgi:2-amino-4-hydroxy-6-hydroxymethyldihydropteridine diphosphokinase